jgi:ORF6N domain
MMAPLKLRQSPRRLERFVCNIRETNVILDADLAALYDVSVGALNQAVKRNRDRFPPDFIFRLTKSETDALKSQTVISNAGRGGRRTRPNAFTEQGVAMLSSVLRSDRAVRVNVEIMRTFVRLRRWIVTHKELAARLERLEEKYDDQFTIVFEAIREIMRPVVPTKRAIGFGADRPTRPTLIGKRGLNS